VRVFLPGVHGELPGHLATEAILGEHASDGLLHEPLGMLAMQLLVGDLPDAAGVPGVPVVDLLLGLLARQPDLPGVDHDDVVAGVEVGSVGRLVLPPKDLGHLGGHPAQHRPLGVHHVPGAADLLLLRTVGLHRSPDSRDRVPVG
jgi:hypothetical protein